MFRGQYDHNMDSKGRVSLPVKFKEHLQKQFGSTEFIITTHLDKCLIGYPQKEWEKMEKSILALPTFDKGALAIRRLFLGPATECSLDKNGRFLIQPSLKEHAELSHPTHKEIVFVGMTNKFEVWSKPLWQKTLEKLKKEETLKQVNELISELQI